MTVDEGEEEELHLGELALDDIAGYEARCLIIHQALLFEWTIC